MATTPLRQAEPDIFTRVNELREMIRLTLGLKMSYAHKKAVDHQIAYADRLLKHIDERRASIQLGNPVDWQEVIN